jgi:LytS/YehU family sensor histidine kinase
LALTLHNIAGIYNKRGDTVRALDNYFISMRIHEELKDKQGISNALNNISVIYREKGDLKNAFEYGERSLKIREELADRTGIAYTIYNLGEACLMQGNLLKAKQYGERSLELGEQVSNPDIILNAANLLQKILKKQRKWEEALQMTELYFRMRDSTDKKENRTIALRQQVKYEYEKRAVADSIKYFSAQHERDLKIQQQRKIFWYLIAGFTVLVVFSLLALRLYNQKKKTAFSRKVLETEMKALRSQMNPHFTFNVLNSIQYYAGGNDMEAVQLYLHKFSILIRMILDQSRTSYISLEQEIVMLKLYMELEEMRFEKKFTWSIDIDPSLHLSTIMIPGMLIQPLLENAIKHGIEHKKGTALISLAFSSNNSTLLCTITDNGIGRAAAEKLKKSSSKHFSAATKILNERIEALSALYNIRLNCITKDLFDKDGNSCGTRVSLEVPLNLSQT